MKHAKKMILVEAPSENLMLTKNFAENYIKPSTAFNLDQELKSVLNRSDLKDHEKWKLYNQSLHRFLFHLNEERNRNPYEKLFQTSINRAPKLEKEKFYNRQAPFKREPTSNPLTGKKVQFDLPELYTPKFELPQSKSKDVENLRNLFDMKEDEERVVDQDSLYKSALEVNLPEFDSEEEKEYDNDEKKVNNSSEDFMDIDEIIKKRELKRKRLYSREPIEKRPRYNGISPIEKQPQYIGISPFQRWKQKLQSSKSKNNIQRLLNSLARRGVISMNSALPHTNVITNEEARKSRFSPYNINYDQLPSDLTDKHIRWLIHENKRRNAQKWESLPKVKK